MVVSCCFLLVSQRGKGVYGFYDAINKIVYQRQQDNYLPGYRPARESQWFYSHPVIQSLCWLISSLPTPKIHDWKAYDWWVVSDVPKCFSFEFFTKPTPQKINIEPGNDGLEDDFPLPGFSGSMLIFQGVWKTINSYPAPSSCQMVPMQGPKCPPSVRWKIDTRLVGKSSSIPNL